MHTVATLERGARALKQLAPWDGGASTDRMYRELRRLGCPANQVEAVVGLLVEAGLLAVNVLSREVTQTDLGRRVAAELRAGRWDGYADALLSLRWAKQQVGASVRLMRRDPTSILLDDLARLTSVAPQLSIILSWIQPAGAGFVRLPDALPEQIHFVDVGPSVPEWVRHNEAVGLRAEQYSLHFERSRKSPGAIIHVASDSDRYGYDIEDRTESPYLAVEVKGSAGEKLAFYLSAHELATARTLGRRYVLHFWGGIDLRRDMSSEFSLLRQRGYPIVRPDLAGALDHGELTMSPSSWRVESRRTE